MLYEHVNADGKVTERVRPAADSKNAAHLAARAANPESGWRVAAEAPAVEAPPAEVRQGRGRATINVGAGEG